MQDGRDVDTLTLDELAAAVKRVRAAVKPRRGETERQARTRVATALRKSGIAA